MARSYRDTEWQETRRRFSHDWLRNKFLVAIGKGLNVAAGKIEDPEFEERFLGRVLPEWETRKDDAQRLAATAESALSSRRWLELPPLDRLPMTDREWLGEVAHDVWLRDSHFVSWRDRVVGAVGRADGRYASLRAFVPPRVLGGRPEMEKALRDFEEACAELATAVSDWPSRVQAT